MTHFGREGHNYIHKQASSENRERRTEERERGKRREREERGEREGKKRLTFITTS